jgi:hypothetical protein
MVIKIEDNTSNSSSTCGKLTETGKKSTVDGVSACGKAVDEPVENQPRHIRDILDMVMAEIRDEVLTSTE